MCVRRRRFHLISRRRSTALLVGGISILGISSGQGTCGTVHRATFPETLT